VNRRITRLGLALLVCYLLLFVQLNRVQVFQASKLNHHPDNFRNIQRDFDQPRGAIASADGAVVAQSVPTPNGPYARLRQYPQGELFAHVAGFFSLEYGADGVESTYNDWLAGQTSEQQYKRWSDLFVDRDRTGDVILTLRKDLQEAARAALGERKGSVVLLDPHTGAVWADWSWPSYDPNLLSSQDLDAVRQAREALLADPNAPMLPRTYRDRFFPGSTYKVVTAAAGLESGLVTPTQPVYPSSSGYVPPASSTPLRNFGGETCGGNLIQIMRVSCNTAFAQMGAETLGPQIMVQEAADWGFNAKLPVDLPGAVASTFPTDFGALISGPGGPNSVYENSAALAQSAIGQNDVQASPMHMALVAAGVANDGKLPTPHVVSEVRDREGKVIERIEPGAWRTAAGPATAATLRGALEDVVRQGTATGLQMSGWTVGAKTGTAELSAEAGSTNAWVIGYAGPAGQPPAVAFAVLIEASPLAGQQTGGAAAVPVAKAMLDAVRPVVEGGR
jgi:peptidoglycan glycosyltransferase